MGHGGYGADPGHGGYGGEQGHGGYVAQQGHGGYGAEQGHGGYVAQQGHGGYGALKVMMAIELNKDMAAVAAMETRRGMADMEAIVVHIVVDRADTSTCQVCLPMEFVRY